MYIVCISMYRWASCFDQFISEDVLIKKIINTPAIAIRPPHRHTPP